MIEIQLNNTSWSYDPDRQLGETGGFGAVFEGQSDDGAAVAIKRLHVDATEAASRELRIAEVLAEAGHEHVMPILDSGLDQQSGRYFIVMPVAEYSLQDALDERGPFPLNEAISVLLDISTGVSEVHDIAHRDLKPRNVLRHDGIWKIADFGIARFVEESTSLYTLKGALSPAYAAPEQWNYEQTDASTDVYALGCIGYALMTGNPPFPGPSAEEFRIQHLSQPPPALTDENSALGELLLSMLRKQRLSRPSIDRVMSHLERLRETSNEQGRGQGLEALEKASSQVAQDTAEADAEESRARAREIARQDLGNAANDMLDELLERLAERIQETAFQAKHVPHPSLLLRIDLGSAWLEVQPHVSRNPFPAGLFPNSGWDVVVGAIISVNQVEPTTYVWSANLWYTDLGRSGEYRWREVSFRQVAGIPSSVDQPFAMTQFEDADLAASKIMHSFALAAQPKAIDDEDFAQFVDRWADLLAKASLGELQHPSKLPLD